jgi:hypothetical protein
MVGDVTGIACPKEMKSCQEHLQDGGAVRSKTIQTKGLFNFMALPPEIRVQVRHLAAFTSIRRYYCDEILTLGRSITFFWSLLEQSI